MQLLFALIIALFLPWRALAACEACVGGATWQGATCSCDESQSIKESYDPLCNGSDPSIILCDGFEDGKYIPNNTARETCNGSQCCLQCDGLVGGGSGTLDQCDHMGPDDPFAFCSGNFANNGDPLQEHFANCNTGTVNGNKADHGAAGTPCSASLGWQTGNNGATGHYHLDANNDTPESVGSWHHYVRFYVKFAGTSARRCPGGWPCSDFLHTLGGWKGMELQGTFGQGGIANGLFGSLSHSTPPTFNTNENVNNCPFPGSGCDLPQNQGNNINWVDFDNHWLFVEYEADHTDATSRFRLWIDDCGTDGLAAACRDGSPTLRASYTNIDYRNTFVNQTAKLRSIWLNWWTHGATGELLLDELIVRDGDVLDQPIGFAEIGAEVTPTPPTLKGSVQGNLSDAFYHLFSIPRPHEPWSSRREARTDMEASWQGPYSSPLYSR